MEQIIINIQDKEKAKILLELLAALDFISSIQTAQLENNEVESTQTAEQIDFFSLAGLWADRDINLEILRQKAWPRRSL